MKWVVRLQECDIGVCSLCRMCKKECVYACEGVGEYSCEIGLNKNPFDLTYLSVIIFILISIRTLVKR